MYGKMASINKTSILKSLMGRVIYHQSIKLLRQTSSSAVCLSNSGSCPKEPCQPLPPPPPTDGCSPPSPCPEVPSCPPALCPQTPDPGNPCNYCPPPCRDGPDLTKIKKMQCHFQKDDGLPVFLKKGPKDTILYQATLISTILGCIIAFYQLITLK